LFVRPTFRAASLNGAQLSGVFNNADFSGANLRKARISGIVVNACFQHSRLDGADLSQATLINVDLSECIGLSEAQLATVKRVQNSILPPALARSELLQRIGYGQAVHCGSNPNLEMDIPIAAPSRPTVKVEQRKHP
jgi:uncharacterized protein YjbI with pentapeptide repeats